MLRRCAWIVIAVVGACGGKESSGLPPAEQWGSVASAPAKLPADASAMSAIASCIARNVVHDVNTLQTPGLASLAIDAIRRDARDAKEAAVRALAAQAKDLRVLDHRALFEAELAFALAELGKLDDARALAREAITHAYASRPVLPNDRDLALDLAALVLAWSGDRAEAREVAGGDVERQAHVAIGLARAGKPADAIGVLRAARDAHSRDRSTAFVEAAMWAGVPDLVASEIEREPDLAGRVALAVARARAAVERRTTDAAAHIDSALSIIDAVIAAKRDPLASERAREAWLALAELRHRLGDRDGAATLRARVRTELDTVDKLPRPGYLAKVHRTGLAMVSARAGDFAGADAALATLGTGADARLADSDTAAIEVAARKGELGRAIALRGGVAGVTSPIDAQLWALLDAGGRPPTEVAALRRFACH